MQYRLIRRIFIVETFVRRKSYEMFRRKRRYGFTAFIPSKSIIPENWKWPFPTPTLTCGRLLVRMNMCSVRTCDDSKLASLPFVWFRFSVQLSVFVPVTQAKAASRMQICMSVTSTNDVPNWGAGIVARLRSGRSWFRIPLGARDPASFLLGTGDCFSRRKATDARGWHLVRSCQTRRCPFPANSYACTTSAKFIRNSIGIFGYHDCSQTHNHLQITHPLHAFCTCNIQCIKKQEGLNITCLTAILSNTNPSWAGLESNPYICGEGPVTNCLSRGWAFMCQERNNLGSIRNDDVSELYWSKQFPVEKVSPCCVEWS
jgi:hypothetical protein